MCQAGLNLVNHTAEAGERASCCSVFCMHHLVRPSRSPIRDQGPLCPFYSQGDQGLEGQSALPKVTDNKKREASRFVTEGDLQKPCFHRFRQEHYCLISSGTWNPVGSPGPGHCVAASASDH